MRGLTERPDGLLYQPEVLTRDEERDLLGALANLDFGEVRMRGQVARRTVRHFGYDRWWPACRSEPAAC